MREVSIMTQDTIIHDPGKFEGEHISVPHFWDLVLDGKDEEVYDGDTLVSFIVIDSDDRAQFPDLTEYGLLLWEDSQGFVRAQWFDTEIEYQTALSDMRTAEMLESDDEEEDDAE
jgi:hypothetical protein